MRKIAITTSSFSEENILLLKELEEMGFDIQFNPYGRRMTESEAFEFLGRETVAMIAGVEPLTQRVLENAADLKIISRCGVGIDNIDLVFAEKKRIKIFTTPEAPSEAVAELAIGLMLSLLRHIVEADRNLRLGQWKPRMGDLLSAKTVGIVGFGRVGKKVAQLLKSFGSQILVHDVELSGQGTLENLFSSADIVTLHLPYNTSTHHLVHSGLLERMKKSAFIINTSRGGIVDEVSLFQILKEKKIAGAALDTFKEEPYSGPLSTLPNVILTPHLGSYARQSRTQMEQEAVDNLIQGLKLEGILNEEAIGGKSIS